MKYLPIFIDLNGKRCMVIGDGYGAEDKVRLLAEAGAEVFHAREYTPGALAGYYLAIAATGEAALNDEIRREADERNVLFNAVDYPARCQFIFPAIHRQGDLVVAVSSSGKSPALASHVRDLLAELVGPEYSTLLELLSELRPTVAAMHPRFEVRRRVWKEMLDSEALELIRASDAENARALLRSIVAPPVSPAVGLTSPAASTSPQAEPAALRVRNTDDRSR
jgi:siroheme synthase-like protein